MFLKLAAYIHPTAEYICLTAIYNHLIASDHKKLNKNTYDDCSVKLRPN